uniref:hypothetical protein n=1 Tax=Candidatus Wujingus californicus TaxID=3367618 RepID=UPI004027146D
METIFLLATNIFKLGLIPIQCTTAISLAVRFRPTPTLMSFAWEFICLYGDIYTPPTIAHHEARKNHNLNIRRYPFLFHD